MSYIRQTGRPSAFLAEIASYLNDVRQHSLLSRDAEQRLARRARAGDEEAARTLVSANLRFVVKVCCGYRRYGLPVEDLIQEGNIGLIHAVAKFEPERGIRLVTYAVWWIRAAIHRHILENWSLVKLGTTQAHRKLFFALARARTEIAKHHPELSRAEELEAVAERLDVLPHQVEEVEQRLLGDASLDAPAGEGDATLAEQLQSPTPSPEAEVGEEEERALLVSRVRAAVAGLEPRQRYIVEQRLMTEEPLTLVELGQHLGFSRERARQLEGRARSTLTPALQDLQNVLDERLAA
ncbi:MAG TPA: RNA polymerase factor sigma-32 [Myxococcales bacterium]|nr:RNA polymerase factor sigma-32 [Myxococcales bacterium]